MADLLILILPIEGIQVFESLWFQLPAVILIPIVALFFITMIKAATASAPIGNEQGAEVGMDLAILATGACGGIFSNETLYRNWGTAWLTVYGMLTLLLCIAVAAVLAVIRRWYNKPPVSDAHRTRNILLGAIPVVWVTLILFLGYTIRGAR